MNKIKEKAPEYVYKALIKGTITENQTDKKKLWTLFLEWLHLMIWVLAPKIGLSF